jgi:hypothetical protein
VIIARHFRRRDILIGIRAADFVLMGKAQLAPGETPLGMSHLPICRASE